MNKNLLYTIQEELDFNKGLKRVSQGTEINEYLQLYELLSHETVTQDKNLATTIQIKLSLKGKNTWFDTFIFILTQLLLLIIGIGVNVMF